MAGPRERPSKVTGFAAMEYAKDDEAINIDPILDDVSRVQNVKDDLPVVTPGDRVAQ
jgi:hypothetical protein